MPICLFCRRPAAGMLRFEIGGRAATYLTCVQCAGRTLARVREDFVRAMNGGLRVGTPPPEPERIPGAIGQRTGFEDDPDIIDIP